MYPGNDPFGGPQGGDPFGGPPVTGSNYGAPSGYGAPSSFGGPPPPGASYPPPHGAGYPPPQKSDYNTYAVLSPIFGVLVPPAGVALGHLALPQIRRTGERGRGAAIAGLVIGYLMCVVLIVALLWWLLSGSETDSGTASTTSTSMTHITPTTRPPAPTTVTSIAPPNQPQRIKMDLATVPLGTCVEIQRRSTESDEALDLFKVDCEHRTGVYTVADRVGSDSQCHSVYIAVPPDQSLAVCLNPY
jgi:Domain of unknown function (DUF4190)